MPRELPIFPLPLVLFPGAIQALHIFEPRYRALLADALAGDRRFGIAYVEAASPTDVDPAPAPAPGDVGCTAEIAETQLLADGRSNIVTVGASRFTLVRWLASDRGYRLAQVAEFEDDPVDPSEAVAAATSVRRDFRRLLTALTVLTDRQMESAEPPGDPQALSFHVAARLELEPPLQLELLRLRSTVARLRQLDAILAPLAVEAAARAEVRAHARRNGKSALPSEIERMDE
jgi:Lon protease-like protein